jgi:hypothetical protein
MTTYPYNQNDRRAIGLLIIAITLIFGPMVLYILSVRGGDYAWHLLFAQGVQDGTIPLPAAPLFHILVLIFYNLLPGIWLSQAGFLATLMMYILTGLSLFTLYIRPALVSLRSPRLMLIAVLIVLALMLLSAITIPTWPTHNLYWGYLVPSVYHNPTIVILRVCTLLLFVRAVTIFTAQQEPATIRGIALTAGLTILNPLAKPNYIIALIPALALAAGFRFIRKEYVDWRHLIGGILIPGALIVVAQYVFLPESSGDGTGGGVLFAPFALANLTNPDTLLLKFFLSILFPLTVYGLYYRQSRSNTAFNLSWVIFAFGAFYSYTLVESQRIGHGNFQWSGQITVFMLIVVAMSFLLRQIYTPNEGFKINRRAFICLLVFGLHVISGLVWYYSEITTVTETRWW